MFPVMGAIFFEFQLFLDIAPVFLGSIITPLTFTALESNQLNRCLLTCHKSTSLIFQEKHRFSL
jgi:hypothetical protein